MRILLSLLFIVFCVSSIGLTGTIDPGVQDKKYLEYGEQFKYVGKLCGSYKDKTQFCASAVLIQPDIILTAAHVVQDYSGAKLIIGKNEYIVDKFVWPKEYDKDIYGHNDIAVGFLKEKVDLDFYPELYTETNEVDKLCCMSGYGATGDFNTGATVFDMKKRAGSNFIDYIEKDFLVCNASKPKDKRRTSLEFMIASGDSGGGLFIDGKLAGINSCVTGTGKNGTKSTYDTESCHTRVSTYVKWIRESIKNR